jgi:hypothetical protein
MGELREEIAGNPESYTRWLRLVIDRVGARL